jgi:lincosamide nucleotidyltransferase A/C/D/E
VLQILDVLATAQVVVWVDGGWGVDALIGRQTREHGDLDFVADAGRVDHVLALLHGEGFEVIGDWLPTAIAFRHPDGRGVDLHPVELTPDGGGDQTQLDRQTRWRYGAPTSGHIGSRTVRSCSVADRVASHLGDAPDAQDLADMRALAEAVGCPLPPFA